MLISAEWINEFIKTDLPVEKLGHKLTMAGLEIEGIEPAARDDHIFEVNITPNRPDALSVLGIARELAAITGNPMTLPQFEIKDEKPSDFKLEVLDTELCPRYAGRVVSGVKIAPSPEWIKERLEKCGIRSINNIVDITNYVLLEFGHPLHAFDLATLKGNTIRVGTAGQTNSSKINTLDEVERTLNTADLLILDGERPVAIAGVMGGAETEVTEDTTDIFIESAYFDPASVRRTSKTLGLSTEASYRFERGTDIEMLETALNRAAFLVAEVAGGTVHEIVDAYPKAPVGKPITVRFSRINKLLGLKLTNDEIIAILKKLDLDLNLNKDSFDVVPPLYRPDITMEADIIEEVARLYGYDKIPTVMPKADISAPVANRNLKLLASIKNALTMEGFNEAVNYSFMNADDLDTLDLKQEDIRRRCVEIKNPLRSEDAHMRTTLLPALLHNLVRNHSHGLKDIRLFETAKVFIKTEELLPIEQKRLAGVLLSSDTSRSLYTDSTEPFFILKGAVESLLSKLRVTDYTFESPIEPFLHPGKSAEIMHEGTRLGYIGVLSPVIVKKLDIKTKQSIVVFELDLEALMAAVPDKPTYRSIAKYPPVDRDIALLVDDKVRVAKVLDMISSHKCEFIEDASVFDVFKGKGIAEGKKSLAFNVRYRSLDGTLTDANVEAMHKGLVEDLITKTGGEIR